MSVLEVTYRKSAIGYARDQRATLTALGLRRLNHTVSHPDVATVRGMIQKVRHLVNVNGLPADSAEGMAAMASSADSREGMSGIASPADSPPVSA